ncbi:MULTISPECIES: ABC transporter ATP-binding protein [Rhodomicrobium]|uniref:ABC transporter ATP-binding protein n=1 Tax=Rhodomicrobium TaxID=1068 RepID=UPI000B4B254A|nr:MULTISPECIES: ABC transporter ATP-binding protein [Rhodomicrobium]
MTLQPSPSQQPRPAPPVLSLAHVTLRYATPKGPVTAAEDISFSLAQGERLALVGPSGCGKSSLLRAIGGFLAPASGRITLTGGRTASQPDASRMMVFQEFEQLLPWRTVLGNVTFALKVARKLGRADAERIARDWLGRVGLGAFTNAYPHTLSGGMKQRVAIARAFALAPEILLMDEPFAALDAITRRKMQDELLGLCKETGATLVFVTHDIDEAVRIATRIIALSPHPGRIAGEFAAGGVSHGAGGGPDALETAIRAAFSKAPPLQVQEAQHD